MVWREWRNRWLSNPVVRARLARWPLGRRVAAHHARRLFGVVAGFAESQMLAAAVDLGVFAALRDGPRRWDQLTDLPPAGAAALLQALLAIGLVEERGDLIGLTVDGIVVASDSGLRAMIAHNRLLYADLADPVALLRGTGSGHIAAFWPYAGEGEATAYSALMNVSHAMVTDVLIDHPAVARARHVMDVGGGHGALALALRRRYPHLRLTLVDLPDVVAGADLAAECIDVRAVAAGGALPLGADVAVLMRVLHDQDAAQAEDLLARVAAALPSSGRVIVAEPMAVSGRDPQTVYFAAYFAAMRNGRLRTSAAVTDLLRKAGFHVTSRRASGPLINIINAIKL